MYTPKLLFFEINFVSLIISILLKNGIFFPDSVLLVENNLIIFSSFDEGTNFVRGISIFVFKNLKIESNGITPFDIEYIIKLMYLIPSFS